MLANRFNRFRSLAKLGSSTQTTLRALNSNSNKLTLKSVHNNNNQNSTRFYVTQADNFSEQKIEEELKKQHEQQQNHDEQHLDETIEDTILRLAMKYVPEHGFTSESLGKGNLFHRILKNIFLKI
jgi:hypothetical protein